MKAKTLCVAMVLVLSLVIAAAPQAQIQASPAIIYVPDAYPTIQDAVDEASSGDTIVVRDGTYTENVDVNKSVTIQSENGAANCTVQAADPNDHVFELTTGSVNITGFTVTGAWTKAGVYLGDGADGCNISDNDARDNHYGIHVYQCSNNTLTSNDARDNHYGIHLYQCSDNTLTSNNATDNSYGIYLDNSTNNTLTGNAMWDNTRNFGVMGWKLPHFTQDIDTSNKVNGQAVQYLVGKEDRVIDSSWDVGYLGVVNCTSITIKDLTMSNNRQGVLLAYSDYSTVENVTAWNNYDGISLYYSSGNNMTNNTADSNSRCGIYLSFSSDNRIAENKAGSNHWEGIWLDSCNDNIVVNNVAADNLYGIRLDDTSSHNNLTGNDLTNSKLGVLVYACDNDIDTTNVAGGNSKPVLYYHDTDNVTIQNTNAYGQICFCNVSDSVISNVTMNNDCGIRVHKSSNVTLMNNNITNSYDGIWLCDSSNNAVANNDIVNCEDSGVQVGYSSWNNSIIDNNISDSYCGISVHHSSNYNNIASNNISSNGYGISLEYSSNNNTLTRNNMTSQSRYGIRLEGSNDNSIYLNNLIDNAHSVYSLDSTNAWNSPEEMTYTYNGNQYTNYLGNHWSDYGDRYPGAEEIDSTGIWDTPYSIDSDEDDYPLVEPFESYPTWNPWDYDEDDSKYIEIGELLAAINDYIGGKISISQLLEMINLYISHTHK